jgi:hypothetical protein
MLLIREVNRVAVIAALVSVIGTAMAAWLIGTRISFGWDEVKRQRDSDMTALQLFYQSYGKFFAAWKMWAVYLRGTSPGQGGFPASDLKAWEILQAVEEAESGFETILVKLASEFTHTDRDRQLFAAFRQAGQSLREAIREGKDLTWKAQRSSPRDIVSPNPRRDLEFRQYRAFKALCEYVAVSLARGPYGERATRGRLRRLFLGPGQIPRISHSIAASNLIAITQTQDIGGQWQRIAEEEFGLDEPAALKR